MSGGRNISGTFPFRKDLAASLVPPSSGLPKGAFSVNICLLPGRHLEQTQFSSVSSSSVFQHQSVGFWEDLRSVSAGLGTLRRQWFIQWLSSIIKASLVTSWWWLTDPQIHDDYKKKLFPAVADCGNHHLSPTFLSLSGRWKNPECCCNLESH